MSVTKQITAGVCLVLIAGVLVWFLNRGYGETSETGYQYAVALFRICNQKDTEALKQVASEIEDQAASGELAASETKWLQQIIAMAEANEWSSASAEIRELMEDQVQYVDIDQ